MKKWNQWRERTYRRLELPAEVANKDSIVTFIENGNVFIENYRSILKYHNTEIIIRTSRGKLIISGKKLEILKYTSEEMIIQGDIAGIFSKRR